MRFRIILLLSLLSGGRHLFAQNGVLLSHLQDQITAQQYQPAWITGDEDRRLGFHTNAAGWLNNSGFTLKGVFDENGYITYPTRKRMVDQSKNGTAIAAGYTWEYLNVNARLGSMNWSFFIRDKMTATAQLGAQGTLGLILLGNKTYAGQGPITDDKLRFGFQQVREIGAGTGFSSENIQFGARLKFLQGINYAGLDRSSMTFNTSALGTTLDLSADYSVWLPDSGKKGMFHFQGFGGAADVGAVIKLSDNLSLDASVTDLGVIGWRKMNHMQAAPQVTFEGIEVTSLFDQNPTDAAQETVDSLKGVLLPDTVVEGTTRLYGCNVRLGTRIRISDNSTLIPLILYTPFQAGGYTRIPMLSVSWLQKFGDYVTIGASLSGGGNEYYGFGLMGALALPVGANRLNILISSDNLLGLVLPGISRGMSLQAGIGFDILD